MLAPIFLTTFQIWRLISGTFMHMDILGLLFSLISYVPQGMMEEREMGTVPFALRFLVLSTFINLAFSMTGIILGYSIYARAMVEPAMGLWPILFCEMVM